MPRLRNEESEQTQYKDGDVVWVKIHNTEIWWPGEVTSSQDFRFVNTSRPPFAVVAFFNEKTFEQVRSPKLICPFHCDHKDQFIQRGTKKAVGLHMKEKFTDDVNIAECRLKRQTASMSTSSSLMDIGYPTSRPDSLIKALLSSSCSNRSSSTRDSIAGSSITTTTTGTGLGIGGSTSSSTTTTTSGQNEPTFRIMDIGGGGSNSNASSQERRCDVTNYDCNLCSFRTNSMSVLLIHRRVHLEQRPSHDGGGGGGGGGGPSSSSAASGSSHTSNSNTNSNSGHRLGLGQHSRAARRANTTNLIDSRPHHYTHHQRSHHSQQQTPQQHSESRNHSIGSAKFLRNSLRCHSRHVSIQVEGVLSDEAQLMVASIAQRTMDSIERMVEPRDTDSSSSPMSFLDHGRSPHQIVTHQQQSTQTKTTAAVSASTQLSLRSPRRQRSNQLRATMPAPMPATPDFLAQGPSPSKQRRLTRSMSRRQLDATPPTGPPIESPALKANLSPPITTTPRRSGSRRSTTNNRPRNLMTTITTPTTPQHEPETPPAPPPPPPPPPAIVVEPSKPATTTTTKSSKTRSRKRTREISPLQVTASVPQAPPSPPAAPSVDGSPMDLEPSEPPAACTSIRTPPRRDNNETKNVSSSPTAAAAAPPPPLPPTTVPPATTPQVSSSPPTQKNLPLKPASLELQMSLLAEWCDDETEEQWPTTTTTNSTSTTNGDEQQERVEQREEDKSRQQQSLKKVNDAEMETETETETETDEQSLAKKLSLLAEWQHDDDEQPKMAMTTTAAATNTTTTTTTTMSTSNGDQEMMTIATKKRIRNIPKKERRNVMMQQKQQQQQQQQQQQAHQDGEERIEGNTNGDKGVADEDQETPASGVSKVDADAAAAAETTPDEPIVIQDSDASSNESVVFIEAEPRQRGKVSHLAGTAETATGTGAAVGAGVTAATTSSQQSSPSKGNNNNNTSACCFDFEDEDEDEIEQQRRLQQQQLDGQNGGLSYRNANANKRQDNRQTTNETLSAAEPPDELFKGFEEDLERAANAAEAEAEAALDHHHQQQQQQQQQQQHKEEEQQQQPLNLPIKERQKRIFKSRNKSQLATTPSKEEEQEREPVTEMEQEQKEAEELEQEKGHDASSIISNVLQIVQTTNTNGNNFLVYSNGDEGETEATAAAAPAADITEAEAGDSSSRSSKSKTEEHPKSKSKSKGSGTKGKGKGKSKNKNSKGGKGKSKVKAKTKLMKLSSPPPPLPPLPAATIFSTPTPTPTPEALTEAEAEPEELSNNNSNSSSTSNCSGIISPVLSYSTSCSVASNIAVISPEEARELQRSASDAGLDPTNIVDATQPMQRGGVLILEDIRLPNLYQPATVQSSTDSNDSSKQQLQQQQQQQPQPMEDEEEEETTTTTATTDEVEQEMEFETEEEDQQEQHHHQQQQQRTVIPTATASTSKKSVGQYAVPQPREGLLKKREQELLRRYRADMVSGRSAEMCRRVRERWSRSSQKSNEEDDDSLPPSPTKRGASLPGEDYQQEMANMELYPQDYIKQRHIKSLPVPPTNPTTSMTMTRQTCQIITPRKSCGTLNMCDKDVAIAHQQLVDLRQRRLQQQPSPATSIQQQQQQEQPSTRRQRRRSRHASNESSSNPGGAVMELTAAAEETTTASATTTTTSIVVGDSTSQKDSQDGIENPPQLCAGRICAVTTRPIPGYSHTFMLCSLANNNFTPINNVALYLDSEKNHLVPVPSEALTEPPRLADGHPLSAVFADIDFLGGDAVAQVMEQQPIHQLIEVDLDGSASSALAIAAVENDQQQQQVEILDGIMSPMSQVNEVVGVGFDGGEDEELSLHDEQMHANILQLNVNGHRLELEPSMLFSIAEQPDSCIEVNVAETGGDSGNSSAGDIGGEGGGGGNGSSNGGSSSICGRAVLHARDILRAAQVYLQERDLQLVNVEDLTLDEDEVSGAAVPATDLLAEALAHSEVVDDSAYAVVDESSNAGIGLLHIDTRTALGGGDEIEGVDQEVVDHQEQQPQVVVSAGGASTGGGGAGIAYITHTLPPPPPSTAHLTPPITARTNETNALLDQTPIMSALECPSTARSVQLRRVVSPLTAGNTLDDSLAVIGVTNVSATGVPTSLELPITVTNPAIAPAARVSVTATTPNVANVNDLVQVQFSPFQ